MKRAHLIPGILALLCVGAFRPAAAERPNVLFLFADDQRADTIAALGNTIIQTPNLDRLTRSGLAFNRAYMQGGLQGATCVPSRAMLLSGRTLFRIDEKLMRDETWPAAFGRAGYTTFASGKWHNGAPSLPRSFQVARSIFAGGMTDPSKAKLSNLADGKLTAPQLAPKHACEVFADETIRFLTEHRGGPFFCYLPFDAPHDPHIVPPEFPIHYDAAKIPLPPNFLPQHGWNNGEMTIRDEQLLPWPRPPEQVRAYLAEYYRYISYLDAQIGRVLDALAASAHAKNTIVVFAADSGVARGSHGLIGKQNVYEHSVRVPLIISGPGIPAGERTDAMCYLFDVLPTLGKLCGVSGPTTSEGIEFSATLRDPARPARSHLMFAYRNVQRAMRDDRWKLIRYPLIDRTQLFDLQTDPHETTNLADKPEHAAKVAELHTALEKEMQRGGDTAPLKVPDPQAADWTPPLANAKRAKKTGSAVSLPAVENKPARPNFIFILADDLGWADVAFHRGNVPTPHLDKLAAEGIELTQHYVYPVCSPTRAALLSGRYATRFNVTTPQNPRAYRWDTVTLARALKSAGYETALCGKWHLGSKPEWGPPKFGFDHSYGSLAGGVGPWDHHYKKGEFTTTWHRNGNLIEEKGHVTDLITHEAIRWLEGRTDKPFLLYVPFTAVHIPSREPEEIVRRVPKGITEPSRRQFAANVMHLDDSVGRILAALEKSGKAGNTLVVFTSDNGGLPTAKNSDTQYPPDNYEPGPAGGSNVPLRGQKGDVYEGGIRTVTLARWAAHLKPGKFEGVAHISDWMPTFCALAGYTQEADLKWDGKNIWPQLAGTAPAEPRTIYTASPGYRAQALREGDWKLIVPKAGEKNSAKAAAGEVELYDLAADPYETRNLAASMPEKAAALRAKLADVSKADGDAVAND